MVFETRLLLLVSLLSLAAGPASALTAAMKQDELACRDLAVAKQRSELQKSSNANALRSFSQRWIAAGDCVMLRRKAAVAIDTRQDAFSCVRAEGGLDCFWAANGSIDEHPGYKAGAAKIPAQVMPMFRFPGYGPVQGGSAEAVEHGVQLHTAGDGSRN